MKEKARILEDKVNRVTSSDSSDARILQAQCFAEQAYILAFDNENKKPGVEMWTKAIARFNSALKLGQGLLNDTEIAVWNYYLAKCHSRKERRMDRNVERVDSFICALTLFYEVAQEKDVHIVYRGRSLAHIGYMLSTVHLSPEEITTLISQRMPEHLAHLDTEMAFKEALELVEDHKIYSRQGQAFRNLEKFEESEKSLGKSIQLRPTCNLFAYRLRFQLYMKWYRYLQDNKRFRSDDRELLVKAKKDCKTCIEEQSVPKDLADMGRICHLLGKHILSNVGVIINDSDLRESVDHYNKALALCVSSPDIEPTYLSKQKLYISLGKVLADLTEYRHAVECMKRANELTTIGCTECGGVFLAIKYLCILFKQSSGRNKNEFIVEMSCILNEALKVKYNDRVFESVLKKHVRLNPVPMFEVCKYNMERMLWSNPHRHIAHNILSMLQFSIENDFGQFRRNCGHEYNEIPDYVSSSLQNWEELVNEFMQPSEENLQKTVTLDDIASHSAPEALSSSEQDYEYDFFVSHSVCDSDWVKTILLPKLERFGEFRNFKGE